MKLTLILLSLAIYTSNSLASDFDDTIDNWKSYKDVGQWLDNNFRFDKKRQETIRSRLQSQGPDGLLVRDPHKFFFNSSGYCADAANFAIESINNIDPEYNAQWVFIKNEGNGPNHWVTGFYVDDELYIMDYGTGPKWGEMKGIHGPYTSLIEYENYLGSLKLQSFKLGKVFWRDMPGQID